MGVEQKLNKNININTYLKKLNNTNIYITMQIYQNSVEIRI